MIWVLYPRTVTYPWFYGVTVHGVGKYTTSKAVFVGGLNFLAFDWNVALDGAFVISRPWKDAGTWRTDRLRAASLVPLRLDLSGSVSALTNAPPRATSR